MKRVLPILAIIAMALFGSRSLLAQNDPFLGVWKLNPAKCKYVNAPPAPRSETRTVEAVGKSIKITLDGVNLDGSHIGYSYTTNFDGEQVPIVGENRFFGENMISMTRVDAYTFTAQTKKGDVVLRDVRGVVSKDGKVTTLTAKGHDDQGRPATAITVWEKQ